MRENQSSVPKTDVRANFSHRGKCCKIRLFKGFPKIIHSTLVSSTFDFRLWRCCSEEKHRSCQLTCEHVRCTSTVYSKLVGTPCICSALSLKSPLKEWQRKLGYCLECSQERLLNFDLKVLKHRNILEKTLNFHYKIIEKLEQKSFQFSQKSSKNSSKIHRIFVLKSLKKSSKKHWIFV